MNIKKIHALSGRPLERVSGTNDWYYSANQTGDLYEAEEIIHNGHVFEGSTMYFIHYPDGKVIEPIAKAENVYIQRPIWDNGKIVLLRVDFNQQEIAIIHINLENESSVYTAKLPLSSVTDCYNLNLTQSPLTLYRQGWEKQFEIIWPESITFQLEQRESFTYRDGDQLYFSIWDETPAYQEEVRVRKVANGELIEQYSGTLYDMPDGNWWLL